MKKRKLKEPQEFEIMKLVLDKFLWLGFAIMVWGLYNIIDPGYDLYQGFIWIIVGAVLLLLFTWIVTKEYEIIR